MTTEANQTTTEPEQTTAPPPKAPIDTKARKPRTSSLPPATRFPVGAVPQIFVPLAGELGDAGTMGDQMFRDVVRTLEDAERVVTVCADGEDQIIKSENELRRNATHTGRLAMVEGKVTAVPGQYDELARAMGPALDKAITDIDARIKRHATLMLTLLAEMDKALNCTTTAADKNLMSELRQHILSMSTAQRRHFALKAAHTGDKIAIHVILNSPAYLMGLEDKDLQDVRDTARKAVSPALCRAFDIGKKAEKAIELAKKSLVEKKGRVERYRFEDQKKANDALSAIRAL